MNLVWLRNDLRLDDNPALFKACQDGQSVKVIYCATPGQWQQHGDAAVKLGFRSDALTDIRDRLAQLGIEFELLHADHFDDLATLLSDYCRQYQTSGLWFNEELPLDEKRRDKAVISAMKDSGVQCHMFSADQLVPLPIRNKQGGFFKVFTPWYRAWLRQLADNIPETFPEPQAIAEPLSIVHTAIELPGSSVYRKDLWPGNEGEALTRLQQFVDQQIVEYHAQRDYPSYNGTSTLSPYLASGLISTRRCLQIILYVAATENRDWRDDTWLRELAWREFYRYLMVCFPHLCKGQPFKSETLKIAWEQDPQSISAWQQGATGFPLIDAGMRQLIRTGWMHNRLRMLTASFFCKLMLIDWRQGEQFFMRQLLDGDFASNNGGWQWSASTGCDASPWFRIFNPITQSERFDPQGKFIRKMIPELASLDDKTIHNPTVDMRKKLGYPEPILDYKLARQRVLERFKNL